MRPVAGLTAVSAVLTAWLVVSISLSSVAAVTEELAAEASAEATTAGEASKAGAAGTSGCSPSPSRSSGKC